MNCGWLSTAIAALAMAPYAVRVLGWRRGWNNLRTTRGSVKASELTVVIPARNASQSIALLLGDLAAQSQAVAQVIVVDDQSSDRTSQTVEDAINGQPTFEIIASEGVGKKAALITGVGQADTTWVATLDADVRLGPEWSRAMCASIQPATVLLIGPVRLGPTANFFDALQSLDYAAMMGWAAATAGRGRAEMASGANLVFRRSNYPVAGLRCELASGDDAFALEAVANSHGPSSIHWAHDPAAGVSTPAARSFKAWWQQRIRWGGKARHYRSSSLLFTALIVWTASAAQLALLLVWPAAGLQAIALKATVDLAFTRPVARWFTLPAARRPGVWLALILLHPWAIILPGLGSIFQRPTWKGRKI